MHQRASHISEKTAQELLLLPLRRLYKHAPIKFFSRHLAEHMQPNEKLHEEQHGQ